MRALEPVEAPDNTPRPGGRNAPCDRLASSGSSRTSLRIFIFYIINRCSLPSAPGPITTFTGGTSRPAPLAPLSLAAASVKLGLMLSRRSFAALVCACAALVACGGERGKPLRLATTTSVHDSGLLDRLLPAFTAAHGRPVEVHAVGSGQAIAMLRSGQADVAITHSPGEEVQALEAGQLGARTPVMRNAFVLVGPVEYAGVVAGEGDITGAMRDVAASGHRFVSRADDSGTHQRERQLWASAGVPADSPFILPARAGMAATLDLAAREHAFALSDRGTFLARRGDLGLAILFQGGADLENLYSVLEPAPRPGTDTPGARAFLNFMRSAPARAQIGSHGVAALGEPLFTPID